MCLGIEADVTDATDKLKGLGKNLIDGVNSIRKRDPYSAYSASMDVLIACEIEKALAGETWGEVKDKFNGVTSSFQKEVNSVEGQSGQNLASEPDGRLTAPLPNPLDTVPSA